MEARSHVEQELRRLIVHSDDRAGFWRLLLYVLILLPPVLLWSWLAVVWSGGVLTASLIYPALLRRSLRRQLEASDLAVRIAGGEFGADPIFELTPWPWRRLLPRGNSMDTGVDLYSTLLRVAGNLDWYLGPPRRLWRWQWLYLPLGILLIISASLEATLSLLTVAEIGIGTYPVSAALLLPLIFTHYRRQVWTEELAQYLAARLRN